LSGANRTDPKGFMVPAASAKAAVLVDTPSTAAISRHAAACFRLRIVIIVAAALPA
jgi:hypothetical protein